MRRLLAASVAFVALAPSARAETIVRESYQVPTVDGAKVYVEVRRPEGVKAPIILTYSPYNDLGLPDPADDSIAQRYIPKGYARAVGDVLGTRNSSGCWDYGGPKEQQSGVDLVNFLAKQPWSNGKVAMIGGSYDGTTANMVAARSADAPGLAAVVPIAAISRWYGYAFYAGVRYAGNTQNPTDEGFDTPFGFDFGFGRTPPDDPSAAPALIDRAKPCDSAEHTARGYATRPDYDQFWLERDYRKDAAHFGVPVLLAHGWQDFNVKQDEGVGLFAALKSRPQWTGIYLTQGQHGSPDGETWETLLDAFFDHFLQGTDSGLAAKGAVYSTPRDTEGAGEVESLPDWPPPLTGDLAIPLGDKTRSYSDASTTTEESASQNLDAETSWLAYHSQPLTEDARIAGSPALDLTVSVDRDHGHLVPTLFDEAPDGTLTPITRGFLNLYYRDSWAKSVPMPTGKPTRVVVSFLPQDWIVRAGHRLAVELASSNTAWAVPDQPGLTVTVDEKQSRLLVPIVGIGEPPIPGARRPRNRLPSRLDARRALRVHLRARGRRLRVRVRAPKRTPVALRLLRGRRTVRAAHHRGSFTLRVRVRRPGRYRAVASVRSRDGLVRRRSGAARVR
jgi:X-Pro dipeptidyl-peptidase